MAISFVASAAPIRGDDHTAAGRWWKTSWRASTSLRRTIEQVQMMKFFRLLPASEGPRREFKITLGLRAGYGRRGA
jgi:hypothetical protein